MATLNLKKHLITVITCFILAAGVVFYVNAKQKTDGVEKIALVDQVHFQFDSNQEPIPIPEDQLEENMHPAESNPFSCPNGEGQICSGAYDPSDLEQNSNGDWVPKANATPTTTRLYN